MALTVLPDPSGLGQGISDIGGALASVLQSQQQKQKRLDLAELLKNTDLTQQKAGQGFLERALSQNIPPEMAVGVLQQALAMPQGGVAIPEQSGQMSDLLQKLGLDADYADAYSDLYFRVPQGAQTALTKNIGEEIERARGRRGGQEDIQDDAVFPVINPFEGMTSKEAAQFRLQYRKENEPIRKEANQKLKALSLEQRSIDQLKRINEKGTLPEGLGRLNVNFSTGELRIPFAANPDTQLFVKTIQDFTTKAKDTFGARVTNFELGQFLKRLPTLANTADGRRGNITPEQAETIAEQMIQEETAQIVTRLEQASLAPQLNAAIQNVRPGFVIVIKDGQIKQVPQENLERAQQLGWTAYEQ
jgi:hypothetical protein